LIRVWDPGVRIFHWLLVSGVLLCFLSSDEDSPLSAWHTPIGWIVGVLIVFRLVWGFIGGQHARFANFAPPSQIGAHVRELLEGRPRPSLGHSPLGTVSVLVLLGLTAATVVTGLSGGEDAHSTAAFFLLALVAAHVAGVIVMSHLTRDNLVSAMVTGTKDASRHPDARDADPPTRLAAPVAAVVIGAAAYTATRVDPQAFVPHTASDGMEAREAGGHPNGRQGNEPRTEED